MSASSTEDTITVRVGETRTVTLPGRGGAGYSWEARADDPSIADVTECRTEPPPHEPGTAFATASAAQTFALRGVRQGTTTVHFVQRRPFAPERVLAERHLTVLVSCSLSERFP